MLPHTRLNIPVQERVVAHWDGSMGSQHHCLVGRQEAASRLLRRQTGSSFGLQQGRHQVERRVRLPQPVSKESHEQTHTSQMGPGHRTVPGHLPGRAVDMTDPSTALRGAGVTSCNGTGRSEDWGNGRLAPAPPVRRSGHPSDRTVCQGQMTFSRAFPSVSAGAPREASRHGSPTPRW